MTREELALYDGRNGRRAFVAVNGRIYDVSASKFWKGGDHLGAHQAGQELGEALGAAPHIRAVVERFPMVGELKSAALQEPKSKTPMLVGWAVVIGAIVLCFLFWR